MSLENLEFVVLVVAGLVIIDAAIETFKLLTRHREVKRARFLEEGRTPRTLHSGEETDRNLTERPQSTP